MSISLKKLHRMKKHAMNSLTDQLQYLYGQLPAGLREIIMEAMAEIKKLSACKTWLQWCMDNCDDSPEWNFGTDATEKINALLMREIK